MAGAAWLLQLGMTGCISPPAQGPSGTSEAAGERAPNETDDPGPEVDPSEVPVDSDGTAPEEFPLPDQPQADASTAAPLDAGLDAGAPEPAPPTCMHGPQVWRRAFANNHHGIRSGGEVIFDRQQNVIAVMRGDWFGDGPHAPTTAGEGLTLIKLSGSTGATQWTQHLTDTKEVLLQVEEDDSILLVAIDEPSVGGISGAGHVGADTHIYRFRADGTLHTRHELLRVEHEDLYVTSAAADEALYLVGLTTDEHRASSYCRALQLDLETGKILWSQSPGNGLSDMSVPFIALAPEGIELLTWTNVIDVDGMRQGPETVSLARNDGAVQRRTVTDLDFWWTMSRHFVQSQDGYLYGTRDGMFGSQNSKDEDKGYVEALKLDPRTGKVIWETRTDSTATDLALGIRMDGLGRPVIHGTTFGAFGDGAPSWNTTGVVDDLGDNLLLTLNPMTGELELAQQWGIPLRDYASAAAESPCGDLAVLGRVPAAGLRSAGEVVIERLAAE